jgi:MtaA/CmuA family methyltransferase
LVNDLNDLDKLQVPDPRSAGKVPSVLQAVEILQNKMGNVPIFLGIITPWTLATQLRGETVCLLDMVNENRLLEGLLDRSTEFILEYVKEASKRGVDQIVLEEPMANENVMDLEMFRKFVEPYEDIIANEMRAEGIESMLQIAGAFSGEQLDRIVEVDVDALCVDECVDIRLAKEICQARGMLVFGNVCTTSVLLNGDHKMIRRSVKKCLSEGADAVAPGSSLELHTPTDNLVAMTSAAKRPGTGMRKRGA